MDISQAREILREANKINMNIISPTTLTGIVPPNGGTWQEFVDGLDDAATPAKYNHHWS